MPQFDRDLVCSRLGEFRRNLLDTSLRNRLINFRARTKAGKPLDKVVEIHGEDPVEIVRILVTLGKAMSFLGRPDPKGTRQGEAGFDEFSVAENYSESVDKADLKLNTRDTVSALQRKLTKIHRDARVALEEQGVNILFLALGSLVWHEEQKPEEERRAPLVLLPVTLERTAGGAFRLKWDGGDPVGNLSIAAKVKAEYGLTLPPLPDELEIAAYMALIQGSIISRPTWRVERDSVSLAFFSYAKFLIHVDLDVRTWPPDDHPCDHLTFGALLDSGFDEPDDAISDQAHLDPIRPSREVCEVYDADGSQTLAILEAASGRSMVIEGPPGTGKSQTITNLIAEYVGAGKKVLFVAEKAAALDVVFRRLREAHLGDACLELHSNKTNKKAFYGELKRTVSLAAPRTANAETDLKRLDQSKQQLNAYAEAVNTPVRERSITPRYAMGRLIALGKEETPEGRHDFSRMHGWDEQAFQERKVAVEKLQNQVSRIGQPRSHPYFGCTLTHLIPQDKEDIARMLALADEAVAKLARSGSALAERLRVELPVLPSDVEKLKEWAHFVANAPDVTGVPVDHPDWSTSDEEIRTLISTGRRLTEIESELGPDSSGRLARDISGLQRLLCFEGLLVSPSHGRRPSPSLLERLQIAFEQMQFTMDRASVLSTTLGMSRPGSLSEVEPIVLAAKRLSTAPETRGIHVAEPGWLESEQTIHEALSAARTAQTLRQRYGHSLSSTAWEADFTSDLSVIRHHSSSMLRFLNGSYRGAMARTGALYQTPPKDPQVRIASLQSVLDVRSAEQILGRQQGRCSILFGEAWKGAASKIDQLEAAASWTIEMHRAVDQGKVPLSGLRAIEQGVSSVSLGTAAEELQSASSVAVNVIQDFLRHAITENFLPIDVNHSTESAAAWLIGTFTSPVLEIFELTGSTDVIRARRTLDLIAEAQAARDLLQAARPEALGTRWSSSSTNWNSIELILNWVTRFRKDVSEGRLPLGLVEFFAEERPRDGLTSAVEEAQSDRRAAQAAVRDVLMEAQLHDDPAEFTEDAIAIQQAKIRNWRHRLDDLQSLIVYNSICADACRLGLDESVELSQEWHAASARLAEAFERTWYTGVIREAMKEREPLRHFDRVEHEKIALEFRALDTTALHYNRAKVSLAHWRAVPRQFAGGAIGWLQTQFELKQSHRAIRTAMEKAGDAIQAIKPVFLMSPISVAMYLPTHGPRFDVVIFDEASQVKPEDAFGGILRAKQTIVVGDSKQMPPTSFFDKLTGDEGDEDEETTDEDINSLKELESVLAMMSSKIPRESARRRWLRWHYRSRHDALIQTSNRLFYDDRLVVFPSPYRSGAGAGLVLRHDPSTVYGRGGSRKNPKEAESVARAALKHILESPNLSLGIVAFSKAQQEAIEDALDVLRRDEPAFALFDNHHRFEPLVVKNLESVQGDERDVIFISIGYGRDETGFISASFGPLNRDGGERRLNVLITRARLRCEVYTNILAGDIRLGEIQAMGVISLRTFLAFAETGSLDVPAATGMEPQSPFEESVLKKLRSMGYAVDPQVGSCGFYIDMAVRHPDYPEQYVLGIECDGSMYHSARSARDRDKLRQSVLEDRGWRIHRIWSTDWFNHEEREVARLLDVVQAAIRSSPTLLSQSEEIDHSPSYSELEREEKITVAEDSVPYVFCDLQVGPVSESYQDPIQILGSLAAQVVEVEAPVHIDEVTRRIREAVGWGRAGSRIQAAVIQGIGWAESQGLVKCRGSFLHHPIEEQNLVRWRGQVPSAYKKLEYVADIEIDAALMAVIAKSFGIVTTEAVVLASKMLGFDRTTAAMSDRLTRCLKRLVEDGTLIQSGDFLNLAAK